MMQEYFTSVDALHKDPFSTDSSGWRTALLLPKLFRASSASSKSSLQSQVQEEITIGVFVCQYGVTLQQYLLLFSVGQSTGHEERRNNRSNDTGLG